MSTGKPLRDSFDGAKQSILSRNTEYLDFPIFVFELEPGFRGHIFNVITCPFSNTIYCNKPDSNILFYNEKIALFVKTTLTLVQGQGEEKGHDLLHIFC
jgi:hypothetical protein